MTLAHPPRPRAQAAHPHPEETPVHVERKHQPGLSIGFAGQALGVLMAGRASACHVQLQYSAHIDDQGEHYVWNRLVENTCVSSHERTRYYLDGVLTDLPVPFEHDEAE